MRSNWALVLTGVASLLATSGNLAADTGPRPPDTCNTARNWVVGANYKAGDRVVGVDGNLYECKCGAATALCDDPGYEPDIDERATDAWKRIETCLIFDGIELRPVDVVVSNTQQCGAALTLTATIANDSPFGGSTKVAFYHSASKILIASVDLEVPEEFSEDLQVSTVWKNPTLGAADITVVADDDGTGRGTRREYNEKDNALSVRLPTCPIPKPGPL